MRRRDGPASPFLRIWRWPIVIAVPTVFGLLSAPLGQHGVSHWLSWIALGPQLLVIIQRLRPTCRRQARLRPDISESGKRCTAF